MQQTTSGRAGRALSLGRLAGRSVAARARARVASAALDGDARARVLDAAQVRAAADVARTFGEMKGVMAKLGQLLSFAVESVPVAVREQLASLQTQVTPMDFDTVAAVIAGELGDHPEAIFATFDRVPVAAASIGQVHRATLPDGTAVAVKVQYPGVDRAIRSDLENLHLLRFALRALMPGRDIDALLAELRDRLMEELDYRVELRNLHACCEVFDGDPDIVVPQPFPGYSTGRVLCMEWIDGTVLTDLPAIPREDKERLATALFRFVCESVYRHGLFNADPHPGNFLALPGGRLGVLDFGCVKRFGVAEREQLQDFRRLLAAGDVAGFGDHIRRMGFITDAADGDTDADLFAYFSSQWRLLLVDGEFTVTPEWVAQVAINPLTTDGIESRLTVPADHLMLVRINLGLLSLLASLGATANWSQIADHAAAA